MTFLRALSVVGAIALWLPHVDALAAPSKPMDTLMRYNRTMREVGRRHEALRQRAQRVLDSLASGARGARVRALGDFANDGERGHAVLATSSAGSLNAKAGGGVYIRTNSGVHVEATVDSLLGYSLLPEKQSLDASIQDYLARMRTVKLISNARRLDGFATLAEYLEHTEGSGTRLRRNGVQTGLVVLDRERGLGIELTSKVGQGDPIQVPTLNNVGGLKLTRPHVAAAIQETIAKLAEKISDE